MSVSVSRWGPLRAFVWVSTSGFMIYLRFSASIKVIVQQGIFDTILSPPAIATELVHNIMATRQTYVVWAPADTKPEVLERRTAVLRDHLKNIGRLAKEGTLSS
jgi:hypothetical protein